MCQFITAFLPESANLKAVAAVFDKHKVGFKQIDNPHVLAQVPPGEVFILTTRGWCDCGTPLGSQARNRTPTQREMDHRISKLRKRGWSQARIERWQEQKQMEEQKRQRAEQAHAENATPQLLHWITFISDLLHSKQTDRVGLLLHWGHDLEEGRFEIERQESVRLQDLSVEHLLHIQDDVLYNYRQCKPIDLTTAGTGRECSQQHRQKGQVPATAPCSRR